MLERLRAFVYPQSADGKTARQAFLLNLVTLVLGLIGGVGGLAGLVLIVVGVAWATILLIVGVWTALGSSIVWNLSRHGHLRLAAFLLPLVVWAMVTTLLSVGGWPTPMVLGYALCVALAVLIGGPLNGLAWATLSVLAYGVIGVQWDAGRLPTILPVPEKSLNVNLLVLSVGLIALGLLFYAFDRLLEYLSRRQLAQVRRYADELERGAREREELIARLQQTTQEQERLLQTIRSISAPVLPLFEGLIVMPIVGELDMVRAELLFDDMLNGITHYRANFVLLDLTGLSAIDTGAARELLKAVQGAEMLGCRCYLVGVQPAVAQALIYLDVDFSVLGCYSTLQEGVSDLLRQVAASPA